MARIRRYLGRVEVWLDRRERAAVLHAVDTLRTGAEGPRLRPRAYEEPELDREYRRLSGDEVEEVWRSDLEALRGDLADAKDVNRLDEDRALTWLRALNRLRLVAADRLGIEDDGWESAVDPATVDLDTYAMLTDLAWIQEGIVSGLES